MQEQYNVRIRIICCSCFPFLKYDIKVVMNLTIWLILVTKPSKTQKGRENELQHHVGEEGNKYIASSTKTDVTSVSLFIYLTKLVLISSSFLTSSFFLLPFLCFLSLLLMLLIWDWEKWRDMNIILDVLIHCSTTKHGMVVCERTYWTYPLLALWRD